MTNKGEPTAEELGIVTKKGIELVILTADRYMHLYDRASKLTSDYTEKNLVLIDLRQYLVDALEVLVEYKGYLKGSDENSEDGVVPLEKITAEMERIEEYLNKRF